MFFGRSVWCLRLLHFQCGPGMNQKAAWYPNGRMLRWIEWNALGWPETWRYSQTASPLICRENIGSFLSIKGGTMGISREMIGLSMSPEKSSRSLTLSSILALLITRSVWQFAWVRCCTVLALKFATTVNYFTTEWLNGHRISPDNDSYSLLGLRQQLACSRRAIFEHNSYEKFSKWKG